MFWGKKDKSQENPAAEGGGWLSRLRAGLSKSADRFSEGLGDLMGKRALDEQSLEALEDLLIEADLGPQTAAKIIAQFAQERFEDGAGQQTVKAALARVMQDMLTPVAAPLRLDPPPGGGPSVVLVCGVNGAGKTTTIGKMAHRLVRQEGRRVMIAAGDTFRAAAVEQLAEWASRSGADFYAREQGADAASLAYEAYEAAKAQGHDVLLIDTAGRLHNKSNLMAELQKILRVIQKQDPSAPHYTLLVLDATTGQNAFAQVETFGQMVQISGLIVTKLDGSSRGGVVVGLADRFKLPVHAIGVGEGIDDLQPFDPADFARELVGLRGP